MKGDDKQPFDIFREIEKLMREMVERVDDPDSIPKVFGFAITRRDENDPEFHRISLNTPMPQGMFGMKVENDKLHTEVMEHQDRIYVTADLGGLDDEDLSISCKDDVVTIGFKESDFKQDVLLTKNVKPEPLEKSLNNGVLELVFEVLKDEVDVGL